ncbi:MAG: asparagine synthetase B [Firmicutes bacterium]|nr:asparagine synthetase B [Bacillota bacterium]MCL1953797.1 asparagine synthetase B [Bacillota bacterium]
MISGQIKKNTNLVPPIIATGISKFAYNSQSGVSVAFLGTLVSHRDLTLRYDTQNHAEIVLQHYLKKGTKSFVDLEGSYSFAIYDARDQKLILTRDRIGTKNIFYCIDDETFTFASTLRQLFVDYGIKAKLDKLGLNQMLLLGPARPSDSGIYKNISTIKAGHFVEYVDGRIKEHNYYNLCSKEWNMSVNDTIDYARNIITTRTNEYLDTDKPYACFLSGGIDSSILSYIAKNDNNLTTPLVTISVDYKDSDTDFVPNSFQPEHDRDYIAIMKDFLNSKHFDIVLDNQTLAKSIVDAAVFRGLPGMADIDSSLLLLCQHTKESFDIAVSGECADEIFGGYPWYHDNTIRNHKGFPWSRDLGIRTDVFDIDSNVASHFVDEYYQSTINSVSHIRGEDDLDKRIRELFVLNLNWFGASLLERKEMMSGAAGLQVQMPFTDHHLVEFAYNLPWNLKSLNGREKGIMRQAFKGLLPQKIIDRKKSPYPKSFSPIYFNFVKERVTEILDSNSHASILLNKSNLTKLMTADPMSMQPWYGQLMRLPQLLGYIVQLDTILREFNVEIVE